MDFFFFSFSKNNFIVHKGRFFLDCKDDLLPAKCHKHGSHDANFLCYYFVCKPFYPVGIILYPIYSQGRLTEPCCSWHNDSSFLLNPPHINQIKMNKIRAPWRSKFLSFLILQLNCFSWSSARSSQVPPPTAVMLPFFIFFIFVGRRPTCSINTLTGSSHGLIHHWSTLM